MIGSGRGHAALSNVLLQSFITGQLASELLRRELEPVGMTPSEFGVQSVIAALGPLTPTELSTRLGMPAPTVTAWIKRLTEAGQVRKQPHPSDGRSYLVEITEAGHAKCLEAGPHFGAALTRLEALLGDELDAVWSGGVRFEEGLRAALESPSALAGRDRLRGRRRLGRVDAGGSIFRIDPATNAVTRIATGGSAPAWLAASATDVWAADVAGGTVARVDAATAKVVATVRSVRSRSTAQWRPTARCGFRTAPTGRSRSSTRNETRSRRRCAAGATPFVISSGFGDMWVPSFDGSDVWRYELG